MLELLKGNRQCCIDIDGRIYEIDFTELLQTNVRTQKQRKVRCQFGFPAHWHMSDENVVEQILKESSQGTSSSSSCQAPSGWRSFFQNLFYRPPAPLTFSPAPWETIQKVTNSQMLSTLEEVLNKSTKRHDGGTCYCRRGRSFQLKEAYQVKDLYLWRRYQRCVQSIKDKHKQYVVEADQLNLPQGNALTNFAKELGVDESSNEGLFFHGTRSFEVAQQIAKEGFDSRVAGSGGLYGKGTYFAVQSCKSAQYATAGGVQASSQTMGTMFLARVAIGDPWYTEGKYDDSRALYGKYG